MVSVVIPTCGRPELLQRATASALQQTLTDIEVVVVIDGADPEAVKVLSGFHDPRVRWFNLGGRSGGARARNAGVEAARGNWIAFLDDDDEWLPEKLARQLEAASAGNVPDPIVSTRIIVRGTAGDLHWPRRVPGPGEPISEYLLCRSGLFSGDGQFQTSAILTTRALMRACPFNEQVRKHDDTEWYLSAAARQDTAFLVVPELLTIWHQGHLGPRVSQSETWQSSLAWANRCRTLMTPKAYASFLLNAVAAEAAQDGDARGLAAALTQAFRNGKPRALDLLLALGYVLFPRPLRQRLRQLKERLRNGSSRQENQAT